MEYITPAPVSKVPTVRSGTSVKWYPGKAENSTRMIIRFRAAQIIIEAAGTYVYFKVNGGTTHELPLLLANSFYWPDYIYSFVRHFNYLNIRRANCIYEPRSITTKDPSFVMGFVDDIAWLEAHGQTTGGFGLPTEPAITSLGSACTSVAYGPCEVRGKPIRGRVNVAGPLVSTRIDFSVANAAELRQSCPGMFLIQGTPGTATAGTVLGDVYMELDIECIEFSILLTNNVTYTESEMREREILKGKRSKKFKDMIECAVDRELDDEKSVLSDRSLDMRKIVDDYDVLRREPGNSSRSSSRK